MQCHPSALWLIMTVSHFIIVWICCPSAITPSWCNGHYIVPGSCLGLLTPDGGDIFLLFRLFPDSSLKKPNL
jgi:hypothetical protein